MRSAAAGTHVRSSFEVTTEESMEVDDEPSPALGDRPPLAGGGPSNGGAGQCYARRTHVPCLRRLPLARAQPQHDRPKSGRNLESEVWIVAELPALFPRAQIGRHHLDRRYARRMDQGPAALHSGKHQDVPG